eukprot:scaffold54957_cov21-Phaeocystis_antarctica.AAC.2
MGKKVRSWAMEPVLVVLLGGACGEEGGGVGGGGGGEGREQRAEDGDVDGGDRRVEVEAVTTRSTFRPLVMELERRLRKSVRAWR